MGQLDDKWIDTDFTGHDDRRGIKNRVATGATDSFLDNISVSGITSRDAIIDPYQVVDQKNYRNSTAGRRAYESDLARAIEIQKQQQASYEEWYNSPEQAAIRERAAGMNPDLAGLDNAGSASQASPAEAVPGQNLPTNGEIASNVISNVVDVVSAISSIASLPTQFAQMNLFKEQTTGQATTNRILSLQERNNLITALSGDIADAYSSAVKIHSKSGSGNPFDVDGWFADDNNFASLAKLYGDSPHYSAALSVARQKSLSYQKYASELLKDSASNMMDFGLINNNPIYSDDVVLQYATFSDFTRLCYDTDVAIKEFQQKVTSVKSKYVSGLNIDSALDAANSKFKSDTSQSRYTSEYYDFLDGEVMAGYDKILKKFESGMTEAKGLVMDKLFNIWLSEPTSFRGQAAQYLLLGQSPAQVVGLTTSWGTGRLGDFKRWFQENILPDIQSRIDSYGSTQSEDFDAEYKRWADQHSKWMLDHGFDPLDYGIDLEN